MKSLVFPVLTSLLAIAGLAACQPSSSSSPPPSATPPASSNLLALMLVKKDNLTNEMRGEIYPIALAVNGGYLDVSNEVTSQIRQDFQPEALLRINQHKNSLNLVQQFAVIGPQGKIGDFTVQKPSITQLACSTYLTGQGTFNGQPSLPDLFNAIPENRSGGSAGTIGSQKVDETWRWTLAVSQYHTPPNSTLPTQDEATYKQDVLRAGQTALAQAATTRKPTGTAVVEQVTIYDLNHDGKPEVFGTVRQGADPKNTPPEQLREANIAYANVWLGYGAAQPTILSSQVEAYTFPVTRSPYDIAGTLDLNGDGVEEVIVRNNGYESTSFSIYEYTNNQLQEVFSGATYGC